MLSRLCGLLLLVSVLQIASPAIAQGGDIVFMNPSWLEVLEYDTLGLFIRSEDPPDAVFSARIERVYAAPGVENGALPAYQAVQYVVEAVDSGHVSESIIVFHQVQTETAGPDVAALNERDFFRGNRVHLEVVQGLRGDFFCQQFSVVSGELTTVN